jgi:Tfp pilus assembly protein PilF
MRRNSHSMALSLILLAISLGAGCSSTTGSLGNSNTVTAGKVPRQDTETARKMTAHAVQFIEQSKWSDAKTALIEAVDADVTFGPAHNALGTLYLHDSNLYLAAWEFQYAAKLMPYQPEPRNNLGLVLEEAGKLDDAVDSYDQAIKIEPDNPQFVGNAARARIRRGDTDAKVRELLAKVVSTDLRPEWVSWAREKLVLMGPLPTTAPEE